MPASLPPPPQVVLERATTAGFEAALAAGGVGASFRVVGALKASQGKGQAIEVAAAEVTVLGAIADPATYPLAGKSLAPEFLRVVPVRLWLGRGGEGRARVPARGAAGCPSEDGRGCGMADPPTAAPLPVRVQHLRPRTNTGGAVARVRNACAFATHRFFQVGALLLLCRRLFAPHRACCCRASSAAARAHPLLPACRHISLPPSP